MSAKDPAGWRQLLLQRLNSLSPLSEETATRLNDLQYTKRTFLADSEIADTIGAIAIVASGSAYRYRMLADGRRVVFEVSLPGDIMELAGASRESGVAVAASSKLELIIVQEPQIRRLSEASPELARAIAMNDRANTLRLMAQVMRLSRLTAYERVSHFLLEIYDRLDEVGLVNGGRFLMPLNQIALSDALGMTRFHVNRTLKRLSTDGWIELDHQIVRLHDAPALAELCEYERWDPGTPGAALELSLSHP